jgi:hypothetical protein
LNYKYLRVRDSLETNRKIVDMSTIEELASKVEELNEFLFDPSIRKASFDLGSYYAALEHGKQSTETKVALTPQSLVADDHEEHDKPVVVECRKDFVEHTPRLDMKLRRRLKGVQECEALKSMNRDHRANRDRMYMEGVLGGIGPIASGTLEQVHDAFEKDCDYEIVATNRTFSVEKMVEDINAADSAGNADDDATFTSLTKSTTAVSSSGESLLDQIKHAGDEKSDSDYEEDLLSDVVSVGEKPSKTLSVDLRAEYDPTKRTAKGKRTIKISVIIRTRQKIERKTDGEESFTSASALSQSTGDELATASSLTHTARMAAFGMNETQYFASSYADGIQDVGSLTEEALKLMGGDSSSDDDDGADYSEAEPEIARILSPQEIAKMSNRRYYSRDPS